MFRTIRRRRASRWLLTALGALSLATMLVAFAAPGRASAEEPAAPDTLAGVPDIRPDAPTGYYIWRDRDGINLRTHGPGAHHHFVAVLHTDGVFRDVDEIRDELGDRVKVTDGGHTLILDVHTYGAIDGVNFRIEGGDWLSFRLGLDGQAVPVERIFLGSRQNHPDSNPFVMRLGGGDGD